MHISLRAWRRVLAASMLPVLLSTLLMASTTASAASSITFPSNAGAYVPAPSPRSGPSTLIGSPSRVHKTGTAAVGAIQHVFIIVMENKGYPQVWNTASTPYITSLGKAYVRATNFHAITHPSLPNYLDLYAGSNYKITSDCSPSASCHVQARNLADNLQAAGLTWRGYMQSMPAPCYLTVSGGYAPKHNPFVYFDDIRNRPSRCKNRVVPFSALATDLASAATTPNFAFITPNLCKDMHDCSISTGDTWLKNHVPAILSSPACTVDRCLVAITWDEDNGSYGNHTLTIFAGSAAKTGGLTSAAPYNLFSLLRTVEYIFNLPTQTVHDAAASPMTDMLN